MFVRRSLLAAAALAIAFIPIVLAQPAPTRTSSWLISALVYLGDVGLQKELQLSDDQAKKASDLARSATSRLLASVQADDKERDKIDTEIKKDLEGILKQEQMTRLREVILQHLANHSRLGATPLLGDTEAVKRLKLSEEQVTKIRERAKLEDVLNEEQKKEWAKLVGKPYTAALQPSFGSGPGGPRQTNVPVALQYLSNSSVVSDLKLTDKQQEQIAALSAKYKSALDSTKSTARIQEQRADADKEARALLSEAQTKRLAQIELQVSTRRPEDGLLKNARVAEALRLNDEQQKKIARAMEQRHKDMLAVFAADEDAKKIIANVAAFKIETRKQLHAVLDEKQQSTLKDLVGEPFTGQVTIRQSTSGFDRGGDRGTTTDRGSALTTTLYVYRSGVLYLGSPDLHKELKVDVATAAKLTALAEKTAGSKTAKTTTRTQADATKNEVAALLDDKQMKRFEGIYLGFVADGGPLGATRTIQRYDEVQTALKLTEEQKTKLRSGEPMDKVLDQTQAKAWKELRGEPFKGTLTQAGGSRFTPATTLHLYDQGAGYLGSADLHKELKVNDETAKKLTTFAEKAYRDRFSSLGKGESKNRKEQADANKKELATLLDAKQMKRFEEVYLNFVATRTGPFVQISGAHRYLEVQETLKLTDEQKTKLNAGEAMDKVLDETQAKTWKEMRGEPFNGTLTPQFAQGGPGGGGGMFATTTLYLYGTGSAYFGSPDLHKELKVNDETAKKLTAFAEKAYAERTTAKGTGTKTKDSRGQAEANKKEVSTLLDPKQLKRFEEAYWQHVSKVGTAYRYAEVQEALKLTAAQKRTTGMGKGFGGKGAEVPRTSFEKSLDETQAKVWKQMCAEPFTGELVLPGNRFSPGGAFSIPQPLLVSALKTPAVAKEINLTAEQEKKVAEAEKAYQANAGRSGAKGETAKQRTQARTELEQSVKNLLDEKQHTRLQQIMLQDAQKSGLATLLSHETVLATLKLGEEQQKKLAAITGDTSDLRSLLSSEYETPRGERTETYLKTLDAINKHADKRRETTLTAKQKVDLKTLLGEPFKGEIQRSNRPSFGG